MVFDYRWDMGKTFITMFSGTDSTIHRGTKVDQGSELLKTLYTAVIASVTPHVAAATQRLVFIFKHGYQSVLLGAVASCPNTQ